MKTPFCLRAILLTLFATASVGEAHDTVVHRRITRAASFSAPGFRRFLVEMFGPGMDDRTATPRFGGFTSYGWLEERSDLEDSDTTIFSGTMRLRKAWEWRTKSHFYAQLMGKGSRMGSRFVHLGDGCGRRRTRCA